MSTEPVVIELEANTTYEGQIDLRPLTHGLEQFGLAVSKAIEGALPALRAFFAAIDAVESAEARRARLRRMHTAYPAKWRKRRA